MKIRGFFLLTIFLLNMCVLTGCWDYEEVDKLNIVAGVAIDKDGKGQYKISTEIVDMHEGGTESKMKSKKFESYGDTLIDAIRNTLRISSDRLYWGHAEIVIIGQEVAREGVIEIIDFLDRNAETRMSIDLLISKEKTAEEILDSQSITTEIRSYEISRMLNQQADLSKASKMQVYNFINLLSEEGISPVVPAVGITLNKGEKTAELSGMAVFKGDKLAGFLNGDETKALLFITDKIKGGLINLKENTQAQGNNISLEILKNDTDIKPEYSGENISVYVDISTKAVLAEVGIENKNNQEYENFVFQKKAEEWMTINVKKIVEKVQKEFGSDIFGFGKKIRENNPDLWKKIGPEWEDIFKNIKVDVKTDIEIQNAGLIAKPIKKGD